MSEENTLPHHMKKAVALRFEETKNLAPIVSAKGQGYVADEILKRAIEADVPIQEDRSLVEMLSQIDINQAIPEDLYLVVAEVFAYIYHVDQSKNK